MTPSDEIIDQHVFKIFKEADKDENGQIDLEEFQVGVGTMPLLHDCYTLVAADPSGDGTPTVQASPLGRDVYGKDVNPQAMTAAKDSFVDPAAQRRAASGWMTCLSSRSTRLASGRLDSLLCLPMQPERATVCCPCGACPCV